MWRWRTDQGKNDGAQETELADEDLHRVWTAVRVAQEVGGVVGRGALLFRRLPDWPAGCGTAESHAEIRRLIP